MKHAISWFELPVIDLDRAGTFYSSVLGTKLAPATVADHRFYRMFPAEDGVAGAIVQDEGYVPSTRGALIFLNAAAFVSSTARVSSASGSRRSAWRISARGRACDSA